MLHKMVNQYVNQWSTQFKNSRNMIMNCFTKTSVALTTCNKQDLFLEPQILVFLQLLSAIDILNLYLHDSACTSIVTSSIAIAAKLVHQESVLG